MLALPNLLDKFLKSREAHAFDDYADRLNFGTTVLILTFCALLTGAKQHFGHPISCYAPPESTDSWVNYYHDYCFIQNRLRLENHNFLRQVDSVVQEKSDASWQTGVVYYQWVPYILFFQALFFIAPRLLRSFLQSNLSRSTDLKSVVLEAEKLRKCTAADREESLRTLAKYTLEVLEWKDRRTTFGRFSLACSYVVSKCAMVINVVAQILLHLYFIGGGDHLWGFQVIQHIFNDETDDPTDGIFPTMVLCTVNRVAVGGNVQPITMQCVLMLNFINEKIYAFLYFWMFFVLVVNIVSAIRYLVFVMVPPYRYAVADSMLPTQDVLYASAAAELGIHTNPVQGRMMLDHFLANVLKSDGILLLMFINNHAGGLVTHDLTNHMWKISMQPPYKLEDVPHSDVLPRKSLFDRYVAGVDETRPLVEWSGNGNPCPRDSRSQMSSSPKSPSPSTVHSEGAALTGSTSKMSQRRQPNDEGFAGSEA